MTATGPMNSRWYRALVWGAVIVAVVVGIVIAELAAVEYLVL